MTVFTEQFDIGENADLVAGVKDNIDVAGFVTQAGSESLCHTPIALSHADVVTTVLGSGVKLIGKLNMHELAFGMTGVNEYLGTPTNYLFPDYITGGSSSGCATAVAQGKVDFSIGTDTGGSIRVPAACCGVFGLKPTFGRLSRRGVLPAESSLDCIGPLAFSADRLIDAMCSMDKTFSPIKPLANIKLARVSVNAESVIQMQVDNALKKEFLKVSQTDLPSFTAAYDMALKLMNFEMWQAYGHLVGTGKLGPDVENRLLGARNIDPSVVTEAEVVRKRFSQEVDSALRGVDALVLPTLAAFPLKRIEALAGQNDLHISSLTRPFNLSGHPAITIPIRNNLGKPVGMQLVGAKGRDEVICYIAKKISDNNKIYA
ncbi:amidase [Paraglaciecola arctica]|uniref:Aspartyl-tRNA(Asn)/glutamyl-tRNA (Gln) amidotransferase subunit A n=1 Tax=Paraglaciecola arctica BSs20135 TaxID=493475 RepID=K6Z5G8_9ALTE|nr:amidase [Paraglaciecola arctica]GAC18685.1 aspartyl-tRNA(Asn)/glutamyl-tRNA (Gln) amidotransferase subunit A [Paraglaciecola arctica BSs20135]